MLENEATYYANPEQFRQPPDYGTDPAGMFQVFRNIFAVIGVLATAVIVGYLYARCL